MLGFRQGQGSSDSTVSSSLWHEGKAHSRVQARAHTHTQVAKLFWIYYLTSYSQI